MAILHIYYNVHYHILTANKIILLYIYDGYSYYWSCTQVLSIYCKHGVFFVSEVSTKSYCWYFERVLFSRFLPILVTITVLSYSFTICKSFHHTKLTTFTVQQHHKYLWGFKFHYWIPWNLMSMELLNYHDPNGFIFTKHQFMKFFANTVSRNHKTEILTLQIYMILQ